MQRSPRRTACLVALVGATLFPAACSSDDSGSASASPGSTSTSTTSTPDAAGGTGKGSFVLGDRTYTFDATDCTVSDHRIEAAGKGTLDNRTFTVTIRHSESDTSGIETVQVVFTAAESIVGTNFVPLPSGAEQFTLKATGKGKAEGTVPVTGTGGQPSGDGQLTLDCAA
jgi:hypothetical protein